ncbi:putative Zn-dependent peptidase [Dysgonomonas alginatilytica]|uniref:Putative Zn-dependent peptidase n=1 Tax=Dysgonomonas alginatilytica TaxID=1605892 RepID=A0A2V3PKY6_9BACT|nr:pitrilysin family protein [Dysgonomonas alginatilytica]PXV62207.1 putative Zn-dependent peptidase [Dysgonomonas alginatilytica]
MKEYQSHTLQNGLRIVHKPLAGKVSYCGFIVNAGTRDEQPTEYGMAHFVEHMLFKGTEKRRSHHIINRMESVGGEINAYTNKEETVIYSIFLEEHFTRAFELLTDLTFHSVFPEREIEKEIDVILDEINSYEDSPSELIFDEFENIIFRNSQLGHNILGEPELLTKFDTAKASHFVQEHYLPENMVFFSLGNTDMKKIIKLAERYLSEINLSAPKHSRIPPESVDKTEQITAKETSQTHALIGGKCYNLHHPKRKALHLLNNILGGPGMNSRLNISLREKRGYVYNVDSNVTGYSDTGIFSIYFGCDKRNAEKCMKLIHAELKNLRDNKLTASQLAAAKKQMIGQIAISGDSHENLALGLGKSFMHYNHFNNMEETIKKIEQISASDLLEVANEIFDRDKLSSLTYQ